MLNVHMFCCTVVILQWFVEPSDAEIVLARKGLIQEDGVEILPERITASCLDDQVHLDSCKKYFTQDGWLAVQNVLKAIQNILLITVVAALTQLMMMKKIPYNAIVV